MHRRPEDWHLTEDVEDFLARAGDFPRSRPAAHTMPLTDMERPRTRVASGHGACFGLLESGGEVRAVFYRTPQGRLSLTALSPGQTGVLAAHLAGLGQSPSGVIADHDTATVYAVVWPRHSAAAPAPLRRSRLSCPATPSPPRPRPAGRARPRWDE